MEANQQKEENSEFNKEVRKQNMKYQNVEKRNLDKESTESVLRMLKQGKKQSEI